LEACSYAGDSAGNKDENLATPVTTTNRTKSELLLLNRGRNKVVRPASRINKGSELVENKSPQNGLQVDGTEERGENENLRQKNDVGPCSAVITEDRQ
jgi:hypothetical protein